MQQSGGLLLAAVSDGGDTLILLPPREAKCKRVSPLGSDKVDSFDAIRINAIVRSFCQNCGISFSGFFVAACERKKYQGI